MGLREAGRHCRAGAVTLLPCTAALTGCPPAIPSVGACLPLPAPACLPCSVFFISHDDQFMIKTMHKEEIKLLLR